MRKPSLAPKHDPKHQNLKGFFPSRSDADIIVSGKMDYRVGTWSLVPLMHTNHRGSDAPLSEQGSIPIWGPVQHHVNLCLFQPLPCLCCPWRRENTDLFFIHSESIYIDIGHVLSFFRNLKEIIPFTWPMCKSSGWKMKRHKHERYLDSTDHTADNCDLFEYTVNLA